MSVDSALITRDIVVRYGGNVALRDLSVEVPLGRITGLIGPNGAGKTTLFNACSGWLQPCGGAIEFLGHDITRLGPAARARRGLGRTFQRIELCPSMTVRENLAIACEARLAGRSVLRQVLSTRSQRATIETSVDEALERCRLSSVASQLVASLSTGQRRLVELARVCAVRYHILLLDEPASGLDSAETGMFAGILRDLVAERGAGILLVEHDMSLIMEICDYIYVLDFGTLIFEGTPEAVRGSDVVRAAYLGSEEGLEELEDGVDTTV